MATVLVTGSTGFVGSHIVRTLVEAGHKVRALRRSSSRMDLLEGLPVEHVTGDVLDQAALEKAMRGCDWVFHTAAVSDYWRSDRVKLYLVNVHGTRNVLDAARKTNTARVIITSSGAAVGLRADGKPSTDDEPFNLPPPQFAYGHSKWIADHEALRAAEQGQDVVILNPAIILGPGDLNQISGSNIVEFARGLVPPFYPVGKASIIDVRDVAKAHLAAAEKGQRGERYLLGAEDWSYRDLWREMALAVGAKPPTLPLPAFLAPTLAGAIGVARQIGIDLPVNADQVRLSARPVCFDSSKARQAFGPPTISIVQSIHDTYSWYVERGIITV